MLPRKTPFRLARALEAYWRLEAREPEWLDPNGLVEMLKDMDDLRNRVSRIPSVFA